MLCGCGLVVGIAVGNVGVCFDVERMIGMTHSTTRRQKEWLMGPPRKC